MAAKLQTYSSPASRPPFPGNFINFRRKRHLPSVAHMCPHPVAAYFASHAFRRDVKSEAEGEAENFNGSETFHALETSNGVPASNASDVRKPSIRTDSAFSLDGFTIQTETHVFDCGCDVCTKLRQATESTCSLENTTISPKEIIFVGHDGGFVVGKQQQKHHVDGCRCPNCNNFRRKRDTGESVCVTVSTDLLHDMVGEARCQQEVFTAATEIQRRAKIGAANKGKSAWNKGKRHSVQTIAKIKANTAKAMKNPEVKQRMREAAARTFHSETTKFKIRRTVRDKAHTKIQARNLAKAQSLGIRKGKVGVCSFAMHARRVSSVQSVCYGSWTKDSLDTRDRLLKQQLKEAKRVANEVGVQVNRRSKKGASLSQKAARGTRGVPKSSKHKAAISAALKAKWSDPTYVANQKRASRIRSSHRGFPGEKIKNIEDEVVIKTSDQRRAALVRELQETYTKALMAVKTFEEREASGLEVDEIMLKKALSAVAQTRKMLASVGSSRENIETEKSGRNNRDVTA